MDFDLALAARRAVASMSMAWLTLKAAISMTTLLVGCACPNGMLTVGGVSWQGYVSFAPNRTHACNVPLPLWMELELALAARRAVASMSVIPAEWLTLKAAIYITTMLVMCACILNFP